MSFSPERIHRSYCEFLEYEEIVQRQAAKLGFAPGTQAFNDFGLAMNEALEHGRLEGLESLVG